MVEEAETMEGIKKDEDWEYVICKGKLLRQIVALLKTLERCFADEISDGFI